jgi:carbamoyltransferase
MEQLYILGISAFYHDSAAALLCDGRIIAAAQEERFSRKKGDSRFPHHAVEYCLYEAGITIERVDHVVFYDKPILTFDRILASYIHRAPRGLLSFLKAVPLWLKTKLWMEDLVKKELGYKKNILFVRHHQAHAASTFYASPFEKAAFLTVDGVGEWTTTAFGTGSGNSLAITHKIEFPNSLGLLYSAFTYYCGFRVNSGEYKLMGLAPYGSPVYLDIIKRELIEMADDGSFTLNQKYFNYISGLRMINSKFARLFGRPPLRPDQKPDQFYMDIAASIQAFFDEAMVIIARQVKKVTGAENLCLAGGVALNCVANAKVVREAGFKQVWIQPAAGDSGGALGAALYAWYAWLGNERTVDGIHDLQQASYLGPGWSQEEIEALLDKIGATYTVVADGELAEKTAGHIADGKVIGWFQGRMEFGPRALGNRSILGDPRSPEMQTTMNLKIKFRESFRPFAPSVLAEDSTTFFDSPVESPYMLLTAPVQDNKRIDTSGSDATGLDKLKLERSEIPAVTHVDYSARLQTVNKTANPRYHELLTQFKKRTGCPLVINTSFNVRGEPIVCSPVDAYTCFMGTNMDVLVVGNCLMLKDDQPKFEDLEKWKKSLIQD